MENSFNKKTEQPLETEKSLGQEPINYDELREIKSKIFEEKDKKQMLKSHDLIVKFAKEIQSKYPDYQNYKIYHFLIGSSLPKEGNFKDEDFPGEDSIVSFLNSFKEEK